MSTGHRYHKGAPTRKFTPRFDRNLYIQAPRLLVVDDEGGNLGVMDREQALRIARERELDLVLVSPGATPPVARITSWSKFKYEQSKKAKGSKGKSSEVKEMWFKPFIELGDLQHKVSRIAEFIEKGHKVKAVVRSKRGAEESQVRETMQKVLQLAGEFAKAEGEIKHEGHNISVFFVRK